MFYIGIIVLGVISWTKLSINLLPDLSYPKITIVTEYPGSGPEEIERFITTILEGPLSSITGVKKIDSISKEGISIVTLEFHWGTDMDFALLHTKEQVEGVIQNLPNDCDPPVILEWDPASSPIMTVILKSNVRDLKTQKETAEYIIKPRLEQLDGISRVEIRGGDEQEVSVEIDPEKIKNLNITLTDVSNAIRNDNISFSSGTVKKDKFRYILKVEGEIKTPQEIEDIVIRQVGGRIIQVRDIGKAFFKDKIRQGNIRFNHDSSISLLLYREAGGNTVNATNDAIETFNTLTKEFNNEIEFHVISMESELIVSSIDSLKSSLVLGAFLAFIILLLFLQNYRDPLFITAVIPISVIATFILMYLFDVQINIMSLGGLVLGCGMFVDNSIIVLEAIFRYRGKKNLIENVIDGAKEVSGAITSSTLTTIAIFLPVIYLYGVTGKLFRDQALSVSFSLICSLIVALSLLPALSAFRFVFKTDFIDDTDKTEKEKKWYKNIFKGFNSIILIPFKLVGYVIFYVLAVLFLTFKYFFVFLSKLFALALKPTYKYFNRTYQAFSNAYQRFLVKFLDRKRNALYLALILLTILTGSFFMLKTELLPSPDSRKFEINATTTPSYGFEQTDLIASQIEKKLKNIDGVNFVFTESGSVSTFAATIEDISVNNIHFVVECESREVRPRVLEEARKILHQSDLTEFTTFLEKNTLSQYLSTGGENFQIKVFYEDLEKGKIAVQMILDKIKDIPGLGDIKTTTTEGKPLFTLSFKEDVMKKFNISRAQVADYINQAVRGEQAGTLEQVQKKYDIFVRVPVEGIMAVKRLMALPISINDTTFFLKDLVDIQELPSIKKISRESQERFFLISADAPKVNLNKLIQNAEARLININLPENTRYHFAGEEEERRKAFDSLSQALWLAILLVYMIMAAQFENLLQPFIIMFTVPMGLVGAFLILLATGSTLNIISGIGILVLIGIGVNDAIVEVEYANQLRASGMGIREAITTACGVRLRPILMTSFTTIFGVLPMAIMTQPGSELQRPLALVLIGGLMFTTFLTLILIPPCYEILELHKEKRQAKRLATEEKLQLSEK